jgi:predicted Zn-dependent protease
MVNIQFISLIPVLLIIYLLTGCAISPFAPRTPAQVEDRSRPAEHLPTDKTGKIEKQQAPEPVTEPVIKTPVAEKVEAVPITKPVQEKANPAVVALLDNADQYTATGQNNKAVASLERAIRIEPKNPVLWHRLGTLHLQGGNWVQAIAMAKKSNVLATNDRSLQAKNWLLIAKARDSLGDTTGSEQAREMARQLQN